MPEDHARLGPSASERWIACPASIRMSAEVGGSEDNVYTREGTVAHTRAEIEAAFVCGLIDGEAWADAIDQWEAEDAKDYSLDQMREMALHAESYARYVLSALQGHRGGEVLLEQRVHPGIPEVWGTADASVVHPRVVEVVDYKYGAGVAVYPEDNPQLMLYALGVLEEHDVLGIIEDVRITIFQPRVGDGEAKTWETTAEHLREWRKNVALPAAELALTPTAPFNPGEVQCRWCPAAAICRPRMEAALAEDFSTDPDLIGHDELSELLARIPAIQDWCNAIQARALDEAYSQARPIEGWKVVRSGGRRTITDEEAATKALVAKGFKKADVTRTTMQTLGALEKLVGKTKLPEILGDLLKKGEGSPSLVPESDARPAINPNGEAAKDFAKEDII